MMMEQNKSQDHSLLIVFALGDGLFGIKADLIQEVVKVSTMTPVYHAPDYIIGIRNLRGRVVTLLDLQLRLGLGASMTTAENRILIIEWQGEPVGLLVDRIVDTIPLEGARVEQAPANLPISQEQSLQGVVRHDERLIALLNMDTLLGVEEHHA